MPTSGNANPYMNMPESSFWKSAVSDRHPYEMPNLYRPKFPLSRNSAITVAGSCFAQHVGNSLRSYGFNVLDTEPSPDQLEPADAKRFGYGVYSARYGNIYTVRQLVQLLRDARQETIRDEDFWIRGDRYFDALRPSIEPDGFESLEEAIAMRRRHLECVRTLFDATETLIFTLGLTEAWVNRQTGIVYPTCPGVIAGEFDAARYNFVNFGFMDVHSDLLELRNLLLAENPDVKFLFTVSPVPLTATATENNVLVATCYSKAVLRAVCGSMHDAFDNVDYFPSFEIITSPAARSFFYDPNLRTVNRHGVEHVMRVFMAAHGGQLERFPSIDSQADSPSAAQGRDRTEDSDEDEVQCDEALLEAFSK